MKFCHAFLPELVELSLVFSLELIGIGLRGGWRGRRLFGNRRFRTGRRRFKGTRSNGILARRISTRRWNSEIWRQVFLGDGQTVRAGRSGGLSEYRFPASFEINRLRL